MPPDLMMYMRIRHKYNDNGYSFIQPTVEEESKLQREYVLLFKASLLFLGRRARPEQEYHLQTINDNNNKLNQSLGDWKKMGCR